MQLFQKPAELTMSLRVFFWTFGSVLIFTQISCQPQAATSSGEQPPKFASPPPIHSKPVDQKSGYIGLTKKAALSKAIAAGLQARVAVLEGQSIPVTKDHRPERLNFEISQGLVIAVTKG